MSEEFAFPVSEENFQKNWAEPGMTLRDYFAAKALQGLLSDPTEGSDGYANICDFMRDTAIACYAYADAMMEVRK